MAGVETLMARYGIKTKQGMRQYVTGHKEQLGDHLRMCKGQWQVDEQGIAILDELRGLNEPESIRANDDKRVQMAREETHSLQTALLHAQNETKAVLVKLAEGQERMLELVRESQADKAELAAMKERASWHDLEIARQKEEVEQLKKELVAARKQAQDAQLEKVEAVHTIQSMRGAGLLERLKGW